MLIRQGQWLGAAILAALAGVTPARGAPPEIVVTIAPVHSLVAAVTRGITQPYLLLDGAASPHSNAMKPSQARALQSADLVVWVGPALETFLQRSMAQMRESDRVITLMELPGIRVLPTRKGGQFHGHRHDAQPAPPRTPGIRGDPHVWLDADNAVATVDAVAVVLARMDPDNAPRYQDNAATTRSRIRALDGELRDTLAPVSRVPYLVFHDAYQAMERRYGLHAAGAVTLNPQRAPGAARMRELREHIQALGIRCVFREPQFEPRLVATIIHGTPARAGVLDPMGSDLPPGPDAWFHLMGNLAGALVTCLSRK